MRVTSAPPLGAGVVAPPRYPTARLASAWSTLSGRVVPTLTFGLIDLLYGRVVVGDVRVALARTPTPHQVLVLIGTCLYFMFVSLTIVLFLTRPAARSKDAALSSGLLAMAGTFGLTIAPLLPSGRVVLHSGNAGALAESIVLVVALSLAVVTLDTLGRSFSITPQARRLVVSGPYRVVRHPLYLFEAMAIVAVTVAGGTSTMLIAAVLVIACQVRRAQLEERLLRQTFPEYDDVFRGVARFVPGVY